LAAKAAAGCDNHCPQIGTIILAIPAICELWCRSLGHEPKVLTAAFGSCLLRLADFAHKTPHLNKTVVLQAVGLN
jgi:hypothetical protein